MHIFSFYFFYRTEVQHFLQTCIVLTDLLTAGSGEKLLFSNNVHQNHPKSVLKNRWLVHLSFLIQILDEPPKFFIVTSSQVMLWSREHNLRTTCRKGIYLSCALRGGGVHLFPYPESKTSCLRLALKPALLGIRPPLRSTNATSPGSFSYLREPVVIYLPASCCLRNQQKQRWHKLLNKWIK